ncbi:hypothetical protein HK100_007533, partial [Physocladia obscura]
MVSSPAAAHQATQAQKWARAQQQQEIPPKVSRQLVSEYPRPSAYFAKFIVSVEDPAKNRLLARGTAQYDRELDRASVHTTTKIWNEEGSSELAHEVVGVSPDAVELEMLRLCGDVIDTANPVINDNSGSDIIDIIVSGPSENRIDFLFLGDGYVAHEREKFISDVHRLTNEMFQASAFRPILPLVNVRAVFVASKVSGLQNPSNGDSAQTAFGMTRLGSHFRGLFTTNKEAARRACLNVGAIAANFPVIIANDLFYGGLEGEFTTSTASETSGVIVLRHELGHNLYDVGEEYDNSDNYFGVNTCNSIDSVPWKHWITNPSVKQELSALKKMDYSWYDLSKGPYSLSFDSDGSFSKWTIRVSISGCELQGAVTLTIDGEKQDWAPIATLDRHFYDIKGSSGFTVGTHTVVFSETIPRITAATDSKTPFRQICSVQILEFGSDDEFHAEVGYVGIFPTYGLDGTYFRPSGEVCIMRNMIADSFCPVCQEAQLLAMLKKVSLIDAISATIDLLGKAIFKLLPLPFGQFRPKNQVVDGEYYQVEYFVDDVEQVDLNGFFEFDISSERASAGAWTVGLKFKTPMIRKDDFNYTISHAAINWTV